MENSDDESGSQSYSERSDLSISSELEQERNVVELLLKAQSKVLFEGFISFYRSQFKDDPRLFVETYHRGGMAHCEPLIDFTDKEKPYRSNLQCKQPVALFVTFRPEGIDLPLLVELLLKVLKIGKGIQTSIGSIEQSGTTEVDIGSGLHFHALLLLNKKEQMGEPSRQYKRLVGILGKYKTKTDHFLDIKNVSENKYPDKVAYIKGEKDDPLKLTKVVLDKRYRKFHALPDFWTF